MSVLFIPSGAKISFAMNWWIRLLGRDLDDHAEEDERRVGVVPLRPGLEQRFLRIEQNLHDVEIVELQRRSLGDQLLVVGEARGVGEELPAP